jgi:hypothetical protein
VNFTVEHRHRHRSQAGLERAEGTPFVSSRVIFKNMRLSVLVYRRREAADGVNLAIQNCRADMVEAQRQRRSRPPAINRRIVFVMICSGHVVNAAADHMDFSAHGRQRHFVARQRDRRLHRPTPLRLRRNVGRKRAKTNPHAAAY